MEHALYVTCAVDKVLTRDVVGDANGASTTKFTETVIKNLGVRYEGAQDRAYKAINVNNTNIPVAPIQPKERSCEGIDVFFENTKPISEFGKLMEEAALEAAVKLKIITSRGMKIYPTTENTTMDLIDQVTARFVGTGPLNDSQIQKIITSVSTRALWVHIEKLQVFDGKPAYTKAHGED